MKEKAPKSIKHLTLLCPSAAAVWLALAELGNEYKNSSFAVTREQISEWCGVGQKTVSNALTALDTCNWIRRRHRHIFGKRIICVLLIAPWRTMRTNAQRKTAALEAAVGRSNLMLRPRFNEQSESETVSEPQAPEEGADLPEELDLPPASPE